MTAISLQSDESWRPDQVFLFGGWGCPSAWMNDLGRGLEEKFGCGYRILPSVHETLSTSIEDDLSSWKSRCFSEISSAECPLIVGWSYGGMLAVVLADELDHNNLRVVTLGSRPQFIHDQYSVFDASIAEGFLGRVEASSSKGLSYFLTLVGRKEGKTGIARLKPSLLEDGVSQSHLLASLRHLYSLDVSDPWASLDAKGVLTPIYFEQDALIRVPENISREVIMPQGHLAPVLQAQQVSERIFQILRTSHQHNRIETQ